MGAGHPRHIVERRRAAVGLSGGLSPPTTPAVGIHLNTRNHCREIQGVAEQGKFENLHLNGSSSISVATERPVTK